MAPATFLHIESPDSASVRVLALSGVSVRIGSGRQCEISLPDPALAEVQCILRRRGTSWSLQPVGPSGRLTIDGQSVEHQRVLIDDTALQVGPYRLTLRSTGTAQPALGSYERPIDADPRSWPAASARVEARPIPTYPEPPPVSGGTPSDLAAERERLLRWQARLASRERFLREREQDRRWEPRPRATAGPRREAPARPPAAPPPGAPLDTPPRVRIAPDEGPGHSRKSRPAEPPLPSLLRLPEARRSSPKSPTRPERIPDEPPIARTWDAPRGAAVGDPAGPPEPRGDTIEDAAPAGQFVLPALPPEPDSVPGTASAGEILALPHPAGDGRQAVAGAEPSPLEGEPDREAAGTGDSKPSSLAGEGGRAAAGGGERSEATARGTVRGGLSLLSRLLPRQGARNQPVAAGDPPTISEPPALEPAPTADPSPRPAPDEPPSPPCEPGPGCWEAPAPFVAHTADPASSWSWPAASSDPPRVALRGSARASVGSDWPTARALLAAHQSSAAAPTRPASRRVPDRRARPRPSPTVCQAPASWSLPAWVAVGPALAGCLAASALGLVLAWSWGQDDRVAGLVADRLLDPDADGNRPIVVPDPPSTAWWATTAGHLYLHAAVKHREEADPGHDEDVRFLLEAARSAAPLDRTTRLASADRDGNGLGLSHDVLSLRKTAQTLLRQGKVEPGLNALRRAIELAASDPLRAPLPAFQEDARIRRFTLPNEDAIAAMIVEFLGPGTAAPDLARIAKALPPDPVAALAAYRVLRQRGSPEAAKLLEPILAQDSMRQDGPRAAVDLAAQAEALAFQDRWEEAAERYREAIDRVPPGFARRCWSLNLAEIEARLGRDDAMREAWDAARGSNPNDPINVRLAEARQRQGGTGIRPPGLLSLPPEARRDDSLRPAAFPSSNGTPPEVP
jgi:tetratricopeptide (TPR) repeat protein